MQKIFKLRKTPHMWWDVLLRICISFRHCNAKPAGRWKLKFSTRIEALWFVNSNGSELFSTSCRCEIDYGTRQRCTVFPNWMFYRQIFFAGPAYGLLVHVTSKHDPSDHFGCIYPYDSSRSDGKLPHSGTVVVFPTLFHSLRSFPRWISRTFIPGTPWIALIKRGKCNFDVKVDNAFKSGAGGVLIYNDRIAPTLDKMKLTNDPRRKFFPYFLCANGGFFM